MTTKKEIKKTLRTAYNLYISPESKSIKISKSPRHKTFHLIGKVYLRGICRMMGKKAPPELKKQKELWS